MGAIFDACRAVSAAKKFNAKLAQDKSRGIRQGDDFARVRFRSRKNPRQTFTVQAGCVSGHGYLPQQARVTCGWPRSCLSPRTAISAAFH